MPIIRYNRKNEGLRRRFEKGDDQKMSENLETIIIEKIEMAMIKQKMSKTSKERMFYLGQRIAYQNILSEVYEEIKK